MKVYFMDSSEDPLLSALFQEEILRHEEKLDYLQSRWKALFSETGSEQTHFGHALILERAIRREQDLLAWLHEAYKRLPGKNQ